MKFIWVEDTLYYDSDGNKLVSRNIKCYGFFWVDKKGKPFALAFFARDN